MRNPRGTGRARGTVVAALLAAIVAAMVAGPLPGRAAAKTAWIAGGSRVNVRRAADVEARIVGWADPADRVEILETSGGWARVRLSGGSEGWVVASRLQTDPPPAARAAALAAEKEDLRTRLGRETETVKQLRGEADAAAAREREQKEEIARLVAAREALLTDARWREWLTGAGIVLVGMLVGAILARMQARRSGPQRLRL